MRNGLFWWIRSVFLLLFSLFFISISQAHAATCSISTSTTIDSAYVATNSCTVIALTGTPTITWSGTIDTGGPVAVNVNSGTVVFSGALTLVDSGSTVTVASGATVTHAAENKTGVQIIAPTVTVTGSINTNGKGCGVNKGVNGTNDCATGNPGAPGNNYGGGAYGGAAGTGYFTAANTNTYGSSTNPTLLGSGGGLGSTGAGGGRVSLVVSGVLTVTGSIAANGAAGGGSGGSVYIKAATVNGTGTVSANGGTAGGGCNGGTAEGGGGRVAIYYDAGTFGFTNASKVTVSHGTGACGDSKNGTTFILNRQVDDGAGTLTFNGGGQFAVGGDYIRDTINITSGTFLSCDAGLTSLTVSSTNALTFSTSTWSCAPTAGTSLSIGSNSSVSFTSVTGTFGGTMGAVRIEGTSVSMSGVMWSLTGADSFTVNAPTFTNTASSTLAVTKAGSYTTLNTTGSLTFTNFNYIGGTAGTVSGETGGYLLLPRGIDVTLTNSKIFANVSSTLSNLTIDSTSQIGANAKGCVGSRGPNSSNVCTASTAGYTSTYGGAGHGAVGGTGYYSTGGAAYGSSTYPILFGSGNGSGPGTGGGRVWFTVTGTLTNNGLITANGGTYGGSGGSIYLNASILAGTGNVSSTGAAGDGNNGCGAGGRIALIASLITFSGTSSTSGGTTGCTGPAGTGTIYKLQTNSPPNVPSSLGQASLVDGSTTSTQTPTFSFSLSDPNILDTVKYEIQVDDASDFSSPVVDYISALAAQGARTFQVGQAAGSGTYIVGSLGQTLASGNYYWRVKAIDSSASSAWVNGYTGVSPSFVKGLALTYIAGSHGSITGSTSQTVAYGSSGSEVTAVPDAHYHFVSWTEDASSTASRTDSNVTTDHTYTATFAIDTYNLIPTIGSHGSMTPSATTTKDYGSSQSFTITPDAHYHVSDVLVDGVSVGTPSSYDFTSISADHTISVSFEATDESAPDFSAIHIISGTTTADIGWHTDTRLTSTRLSYGLSTSTLLTLAEQDTSPRVHEHNLSLSDLVPCTMYHTFLYSEDGFGVSATSIDQIFTTLGCEVPTPIIDSYAMSVGSSTGAVGAFTVDDATTVTVDVPADAFTVDTYLQVKTFEQDEVLRTLGTPEGYFGAGMYAMDIRVLSDISTIVSEASAPVSITLGYTDEEIAGLDPASLLIYYYHDSHWSALDHCIVDTAAYSVTCETSGFSMFAIFGVVRPIESIRPAADAGGGGFLPSQVPTALATETSLDFKINNGADRTTNPFVTLSLNADPATVKGYAVAFAANQEVPSFEGTSILPYESLVHLSLPTLPGSYTIALQYFSTTGQVSNTIQHRILYQPTATISTPSSTPPSSTPGTQGSVPNSKNSLCPQGTIKRVLSTGMRGDDVLFLQRFLNAAGLSVAPIGPGSRGKETNLFGKGTREALKKFQRQQHLPASGITDTQTRARMTQYLRIICASKVK